MEDTNALSQEPPRGVTAEDVWAILRENAQQIKKMGAETDRLIQETAQQMKENALQMKENDRQLKEMRAETDRLMKETDRQFKEMRAETDRRMKENDRQLKEMRVETDRLMKETDRQFKEMNAETNRQMKETDRRIKETDRIVEVKAKLDKADIDEQIVRMEKVRRYADLRGDTRQFYCAMAAMTAQKNVIAYALSNGFYLIMPSGEDVLVTKPTSEPKAW